MKSQQFGRKFGRTWDAILDALVNRKVFPGVIHRILLHGPKGTGKSSYALKHFPSAERITLHRQQYFDDLIGGMSIQNGSSVWQDGPACRAMKNGTGIILDEIDQHSPETRCALHAMMDDLTIAGITLPTGERITPAPGFFIVGTTNAAPSEIHDILIDRFDLILHANTPAQGLFETMSEGWKKLLTNHYSRQAQCDWIAPISVRTSLAAQRLGAALQDAELGIFLVYGAGANDIENGIAIVE
jgi:hypothetical protein